MRVLAVAAMAFAGTGSALLACGTFGSGDGASAPDASSDAATDTASPPDAGLDGSGDGHADAGPSDAGCGPHVTFLSNAQLAANFGGVAGGDAICSAEAADAGLSGQYVSWLAVKTDASVVSPLERLRPCGEIRMRGGELVAIDPPRLMTALATGITQNAFGEMRTGYVWTGTTAGAGPSGFDCNGWTSTSPTNSGWCGLAGETTSHWTSYTQVSCASGLTARLYCFQY